MILTERTVDALKKNRIPIGEMGQDFAQSEPVGVGSVVPDRIGAVTALKERTQDGGRGFDSTDQVADNGLWRVHRLIMDSGGLYSDVMNVRSLVGALVLGALVVGCGKSGSLPGLPSTPVGLTKGVAVTVPEGWTTAELKGIPYTFCTPKELKAEAAPDAMMANAKSSAVGGDAIKSIVLGRSTKVPPDMIMVIQEAALSTGGANFKAFITGFNGSLKKEGILTEKLVQTTEKTPIGEAEVVRSPGKVAGRDSQSTIYFWRDSDRVYSMMVSGIGTNPDATAKKIAETFRVK